MFHKFCWVFMIAIGVTGYLSLQEMTNERTLFGKWETDVSQTLVSNGMLRLDEVNKLVEENGGTPTPFMLSLYKGSGLLVTMDVQENGTICWIDSENKIDFAGYWSENEEHRTKNSRFLEMKDKQGDLQMAFIWTLLDENQLKVRMPGGAFIIFRRVA